MRLLRLITAFVRRINDVLLAAAQIVGAAIIAFAALALSAQAIERLTSGQGYAWMNDFPPFLIPWCVFPLMGVLLRGDRHIIVEIAPSILKGRALHLQRLFVGVFCLISGIYFCWMGIHAVDFFILLGELTETEIRIPFWWLYAAFPVGFAILALFAFERVLEEVQALAGQTIEAVQ